MCRLAARSPTRGCVDHVSKAFCRIWRTALGLYSAVHQGHRLLSDFRPNGTRWPKAFGPLIATQRYLWTCNEGGQNSVESTRLVANTLLTGLRFFPTRPMKRKGSCKRFPRRAWWRRSERAGIKSPRNSAMTTNAPGSRSRPFFLVASIAPPLPDPIPTCRTRPSRTRSHAAAYSPLSRISTT